MSRPGSHTAIARGPDQPHGVIRHSLSYVSVTFTSELWKKNKMKATHSIRTARLEDAARIAVLGAHVWVHTYATAGVSDVIAQYVLTTFTPENILALMADPGVVLLVAEA